MINIKTFTKYNESSLVKTLKSEINYYFIYFIDDKILKIENNGSEYELFFNFKVENSNTIDTLDGIIKLSEYFEEIKVSILQLKKDFPNIDVFFSKNISIGDSDSYYIKIIDNSNDKFKRILKSTYDIKLKSKVEINKDDIIKVYNILNQHNDLNIVITGWSAGQRIFDFEKRRNDSEILEVKDAKMIRVHVSFPGISITDFTLYKLKDSKFIYNNDYYSEIYLIDEKEIEEFLIYKVKEYSNYLKSEYPKYKDNFEKYLLALDKI